MSPLAEGRELKWLVGWSAGRLMVSPLAEGRELKLQVEQRFSKRKPSPLAEGRELKCCQANSRRRVSRRPSRRGVN